MIYWDYIGVMYRDYIGVIGYARFLDEAPAAFSKQAVGMRASHSRLRGKLQDG